MGNYALTYDVKQYDYQNFRSKCVMNVMVCRLGCQQSP